MNKLKITRRKCALTRQVLCGIIALTLIFSQPMWNIYAETTSSQKITSSADGAAQNGEAAGITATPQEENPDTETSTAPEDHAAAQANDIQTFTSTTAPIPNVFTVTYVLSLPGVSPLETSSEEVTENAYPIAVPTPTRETYDFLGWTDAQGAEILPRSIPVTEDVTYYAKYGRTLSSFLNTVDHFAYANGYENNFFRPNQSITRAEVSKLFYTLLLSQNGNRKSFPDTNGKWFTTPVETLAGLNIINGYTNGYFRPNNPITRAEFVKMAVSFDTIDHTVAVSFSDVSSANWAYPYIATAVQKGWVEGYTNNKFKPNQSITRAEAVTIINRMLGRYPDANISHLKNTKKFHDVGTGKWFYGQVMEAAIDHQYVQNGTTETWTSYKESLPLGGTWVYENGNAYYVDPNTLEFASGEITIDGTLYYFDPNTRAAYTGFRYVLGWKRYFKTGKMMEDISGLGVVSGPYLIKVYKPGNYLTIFARDGDNGYIIPVRSMLVSCGENTPTGTYYTPANYRWLRMEGYSWAQWCTQIYGNYLFHSVPNITQSNMDLNVYEYNLLGYTRSLGCIRLNCRDAKWIYDNCGIGTQVYISPTEYTGPLAKPTALQIPAWHTWDPTDPTAAYLCAQHGCH